MKLPALLSLAAGLFLTAMTLPAQTNKAFTAQKLEWTLTQPCELGYLLYLPPGYDADPARRWPLMLFLHGAGERGKDTQKVAVHGPLAEVRKGTNFPFIIVAPQCPEERIWENAALLRLLDEMTSRLRVDTRRVYLTGLSMGGFGSWRLGMTQPSRFAALAPICGGGSMIDSLAIPHSQTEALKRLPVWAFHGAKDSVVPLAESERMVALFKRLGCREVRLKVYPDLDHDSWTKTYADPDFYAWLLAQTNPAP